MPSPPAGQSRPFPLGERELVVMLALAQALQALAIDSMLPALGEIARDLGTTDPNRRQLVIGLFLAGIGFGALVPGMLADRFGRRPVLIGCIAGFVGASLACALVTDFTVLAILRLIQGLVCAGLAVVPPAIVRDRFEGDRMASLQSMISVIFMVVPMVAPLGGQAVLLVAGWRWIFGGMALLGAAMGVWVWLRLPETLPPQFRQEINPGAVIGNLRAVVTHRSSLGYSLGNALIAAVMWAYLQSCQQLIGEHFGAGQSFPFFFGGLALCIALASLTNARIVARVGARRLGHGALLAYVVLGAVQFWLAHRGGQTLWQFVAPMGLMMACQGFIAANFSAVAMQPFARLAGAASAAMSFLRASVGAVLGIGVGQLYDGTARPISSAMVGLGSLALGLVLWSERGRLFRRVLPPGTPRELADSL